MCVLDEVRDWNDQEIVCTSATHQDSANPLRSRGRLASVHAFEYGAQAVAVHGGLRARRVGLKAPPGWLVALRDARLYVDRLDDIPHLLEVKASNLGGSEGNYVYYVEIRGGGKLLARARLTILARPGDRS
jgi:predicted hotdog family 3-hydroxylacyl-ACP dehydratase